MSWRITQLLLSILGLSAVTMTLVFTLTDLLPSQQLALFGFRFTPLSTTMVALISFIGWVVTRYAQTQFAESIDEQRFRRRLFATIAAILFTVISDHLLLFWLGWIAVSSSLHQMLVFYPERPRAVLAAHKKFIFARLAETLLATAFILFYLAHGTASIAELQTVTLTPLSYTAMTLLAIVALMKCAQLPVHGWLLQVVESPTPVSALLHAGIINLGGYLLLKFSPLLSQAIVAQWVLLVVAGLSLLIAASVTMTRVSIKVRLAWSTVAQMALMLVEIALGLYSIALLHLLAHSCYKAYAFLSAGSVVDQAERATLSGYQLPSLGAFTVAILLSLMIAAGLYAVGLITGLLAPWLAVFMALTLWFATQCRRQQPLLALKAVFWGVFWLALYKVVKTLLGYLLPEAQATLTALSAADLWISWLLLMVLTVYLVLSYQPYTAFSSRLFVALNAGFYLDEWATRMTLWVWPIALPHRSTPSTEVALHQSNGDTPSRSATQQGGH
ncbi:NADH-quinone oxidoreductase subunit L [Pseudidiomarina taiwanensis]|uniref:Probable inorganic carbon transporter subunit DabB n=1 Tax=Pseudidiomarina taiwanensis TaxID=337250 RepID=A0A432ZHI4_9GAMM|nr:NADH-quinone oxidoreductase subunit L [Pseudidiomarina taiwanensis]RUO76742.1 NADH-quinone oxidoreductase subunit L [Pseudidiomarina taiwanensis]